MGMSNAAQSIRNDLKAAGYALRAFSIRSSRTGSVSVEIKDLEIEKGQITQIACAHEKIDRDSATGEILAGGNTFVSVRYAREALETAGAELAARMRAGVRVFGGIHVSADGAGGAHTWHVWTNGDVGRHLRQISPFDGETVAEILASRGELAAVLAAAAPELAEVPEAELAPAAPNADRQLGKLAAAAAAAAAVDAQRAEREQAWSERLAVSLDLLRRAVAELETAAAVTGKISSGGDSFELTIERRRAVDEAETLAEHAIRELDF